MTAAVSDFAMILEELNLFFIQLDEVLEEKLAFTLKGDVIGLEACMHKEQAFLLRLRGLDKKRETIQQTLSLEGFSLTEILEKSQADQEEALHMLAKELRERVAAYQQKSRKIQLAIEVNLQSVNAFLQEAQPEQQATDGSYTPAGKTNASPVGRFTTKLV